MRLPRILLAAMVVLVPFAAPAQPVPAADTDAAAAGALLYRIRCQSCHGPNMVRAGGPAYDLRKFPPDDPERFRTSVLEGRGAMPAWKGVLSATDVEQLWAFVSKRGAAR